MLRIVSKSILLLMFALLFCCVLYPLALWLIGQSFFSFQANGSIVTGPDGNPVGSKLIAQPFTKDEYFHPRPSAAAYDASASAASNLAVSNPALRDRVIHTLGKVIKYRNGKPIATDIETWLSSDRFQGNANMDIENVPADGVTTSASGLDPHITLANAEYQLDRVANAWAKKLQRDPVAIKQDVEKILQENEAAPLKGLFGDPLVNVLEINLELRKHYGV